MRNWEAGINWERIACAVGVTLAIGVILLAICHGR